MDIHIKRMDIFEAVPVDSGKEKLKMGLRSFFKRISTQQMI